MQPVIEPQPAIVKCAVSYRAPLARVPDKHFSAEPKIQTWGQWFASLFSTPSNPIPSNPNQTPPAAARAPPRR